MPNAHGDGRTDTDTDLGGHGTSMAELIAGQGQEHGFVGVAPEAKILPVVVNGYGFVQANAIRYAADHGAKVINISQGVPDGGAGGFCPYNVQDAITYAVRKDVVVVAGAGNSALDRNPMMFPADCAGVLAVGAIDGRKLAWNKSEQHPYVSVAAPGMSINVPGKNGQLILEDGTSDSAAVTSGVVALMRAKDPSLSARQVVQRVINTAIDAGAKGHDNATGNGALIPLRAMNTDVPKDAPNPPFTALDQYLAKNHQPPLGNPGSQNGKAKPSAASKSSNSGLIIAIVVVAILALIVAAVVIMLLGRRRRGGSAPVVQEQRFPGNPQYGPPGGPGQYPPGPAPYAGNQRPAGQPTEPRQGPPPSFGPPDDRGGR
jgi:subtilisin family serine protease